MNGLLAKLCADEAGFIVSVELVLLATIVLIGLLTGMTAIRDAVISEMSDVAGSVQDLNQGYRVYGVRGHSASTAGMDWLDFRDFCDIAEDTNAAIDNCILINGQNQIEEGQFVTAPSGV